MRVKGYAANSLRGGLVGLVTMLSLRRPAQKPGPNSRRPGFSSAKPSAHRLRRSRHPPRNLRLSY
ncbi:hypothetical protein MY1884_005480 [Beauveria asiatica]